MEMVTKKDSVTVHVGMRVSPGRAIRSLLALLFSHSIYMAYAFLRKMREKWRRDS